MEHKVCTHCSSHIVINISITKHRNPQVVKSAYTEDSIWRNRDTFIRGQDEIVEFLSKKWAKENGYRLRKELFAFTENKVRFLILYEGSANEMCIDSSTILV